MNNILFYISTHGFGHAARVMEVINCLSGIQPNTGIFIKTGVPEWLFDFTLRSPFTYENLLLDFGVAQSENAQVEVLPSLRAMRELICNAPRLIPPEIRYVESHNISCIVSDIPPLAFTIGGETGVPVIGLSNFGWDWIYEPYIQSHPEYSDVKKFFEDAYGKASLLLRLPMHGDVKLFPRIIDVPLIARISTNNRDVVRKLFQLRPDEKLVLISFGGSRSRPIQWETVSCSQPVKFLTTAITELDYPNMQVLENRWLAEKNLAFEDVVLACDAVLSKPGFGICSECLANGTPLIYTERKDFIEYKVLAEGMNQFHRGVFLPEDDYISGRWESYLEQAFQLGRKGYPLPMNGGEKAARIIHEYVTQ